jgi:hypothetical protein
MQLMPTNHLQGANSLSVYVANLQIHDERVEHRDEGIFASSSRNNIPGRHERTMSGVVLCEWYH